MKIYIAAAALAAISSAGLYGTGIIGGGDETSLFDAELAGDGEAAADYPMAIDDVYSKLISTPVIDAIARSSKDHFIPQVIISSQNNRQIVWRMKFQNENLGDLVINLIPTNADTTRVTFQINIADSSILAAASAAVDNDTNRQQLEKLSRMLIAAAIDQRLSGKPIEMDAIKASYSNRELKNLDARISAIQHAINLRFAETAPSADLEDMQEQFETSDEDFSPETATDPTDASIGEIDSELPIGEQELSEMYTAEQAVRRAGRAANMAAAAADAAAEQAASAARAATE